jgi:hypothetical protein
MVKQQAQNLLCEKVKSELPITQHNLEAVHKELEIALVAAEG